MAPATTTVSIIKDAVLALQHRQDSLDDPTIFSDPTTLYTNRGNKLKRGASEVVEGHLTGRRPYKKKIIHAGYSRYILHSNPYRYNDDGDELASSDADSEADANAAERDPYSGVNVLEQLMPLTQAYSLEHHPALSLPYKSSILDDMVARTCTMLHDERKKLVDLKNEITFLRGDYNWIPCGSIDQDAEQSLTNGTMNGTAKKRRSIFDTDIQPEDVERIRVKNGEVFIEDAEAEDTNNVLPVVKAETADNEPTTSPQHSATNIAWPLPDPPILPPLPAAEESKRLLTAIVQKQTEVVQGVSQLYNNLLRAKRLKETVWRWCRAEGHVDEMSDGEDWVDLEEWGLSQMLTKGAEEGLGMGNGGDDPDYLARRAEAGTGAGRGRRRGAQ